MRRTPWFIGLLVAGAMLAACSGGGDDDGDATPSDGASSPTATAGPQQSAGTIAAALPQTIPALDVGAGVQVPPIDGIEVDIAALDVSLGGIDLPSGAVGGAVSIGRIAMPDFAVGRLTLTTPTIPTIPTGPTGPRPGATVPPGFPTPPPGFTFP